MSVHPLRRIEPSLPMFHMEQQRIAPIPRTAARMYKAGDVSRLDPKWPAFPLTADQIVTRWQRVLVARSREQAANNDYARNFKRLCRQNIVGPVGVVLQAQSRRTNGKLDAKANDAIESAWREFGKRGNCEVTGRHSLRELQNLAVDSASIDGEFIFRKLFGADAGPWGYALQVLDPQRCPVDYERPLRDGHFIRSGIEFNAYGRPLAYHFQTLDEVDDFYSWGGRNFIRVPASEIIHGFKTEMAAQKRGLPWMATALFRLHHLQGFEDAAVQNARAGASKMGFIEWAEGFGPECDTDPACGDVADMIDAEPLSFHELPSGARLNKFDPPYPNGEFAPFNKAMLRGIASGLGVPYNELASDLEGVNFSSIRQGTLDSRERWKEDQQWLIEQFLQQVFDDWLPRALLAGLIKQRGTVLRPERIDAYREIVWQPRRWTWIDPSADVKAAVDSKNNLLTSPGRLIREQGQDPDSVWRAIAGDIQGMRDAGIPEEYIQQAMGRKLAPTQPDGGASGDEPKPQGAE